MHSVLHARNWHSMNHRNLTVYPKAILFPENNNKILSATSNWIHNCNYERPPKTLPFLYYGDTTKKKSIIFPTSGKEAHLSPACKIFHYPQCYHRVRMKIFNTKISSAHQYQLWEWNRFGNLRGCKHKIKHTPQLQESSLQHPPDWIHIQIHGFKNLQNIRKHPIFSKPENHKRHPGKFNTNYAGPCATLGKIFAPKQHITLLPTIYSNYCVLYKSTTNS